MESCGHVERSRFTEPPPGDEGIASTRPLCMGPGRPPAQPKEYAGLPRYVQPVRLRPRRGATLADVDSHPPVRVERRPVTEEESRRANGPDWDRYADEYQATHGA